MRKTSRFPLFRERLTELMGDLSNTRFADEIGIHRSTLGGYLNGDRVPDLEFLNLICEKCNVSADWIIGRSNIKSPSADVHKISDLTGLSHEAVDNLLSECKDSLCSKALDEILKSDYSSLHRINYLTAEAIKRSFATSGIQPALSEPDSISAISVIENTGCKVLAPAEAYRFYLSQAAYYFERYIDSIADSKKLFSKCTEDETSSKKNMEEENGKYKTD